jgi:uncharacterized protein
VPKKIWILSDGKAGHLSQTRGLASAMLNRLGAHLLEIDFSGKGFWAKLGVVWKLGAEIGNTAVEEGRPDFIIAAGHGMHLPLLLAGFLFRKAKTVLCMKPSLPMSWFDFCVVPRHDLTPAQLAHPPAYLIPTLGALHGVHPRPERPKTHTLILIGGPSKEYAWDEKLVIDQLRAIVKSAVVGSLRSSTGEQRGSLPVEDNLLLTTSRRTPAGFVDKLLDECPPIAVVPVEETPRGWVAEKLASANAVWVTRDSVSMIYEALGSGAPVGLLNMPSLFTNKKKKTRVARGIEMLEDEGWVTSFDLWKQTGVLKSKGALVEVDRVADILCT